MDLPKALEDEIINKFVVEYKYVVDNRDRFSDMEDFLRDALNEVYTAARRQALTDGIASLPPETALFRESEYIDYKNANLIGVGRNEFRAEAIAKLTQLRDV